MTSLDDFISMQQRYQQSLQPQATGGGGNLLQMFQQAEEKSRTANLQRAAQVEAIFDEIIERYKPGGSFGQGYAELLKGQKQREVGSGVQSMISSGLAGTTTAAGLGRRWEAEVGAPARLKLEDIQMERLSGAQAQKAGFLERIEEPGPDFNALMQAYSAQASAGGGGGGGGAGYNVSGTADISNYMSRFNASQASTAQHFAQGTGNYYDKGSRSSLGGFSDSGRISGPSAAEQAQQNPGQPVIEGDKQYIVEGDYMKILKQQGDGSWTKISQHRIGGLPPDKKKSPASTLPGTQTGTYLGMSLGR